MPSPQLAVFQEKSIQLFPAILDGLPLAGCKQQVLILSCCASQDELVHVERIPGDCVLSLCIVIAMPALMRRRTLQYCNP